MTWLMTWLNHRYTLWTALALPGLWWWAGYLQEWVFYGELIHRSGDFSVQLLILTLAVTPLARVFQGARWVRWLAQRRRYLGVASFAYALFHTLVYLDRKAEVARILKEAQDPGLLTGWVGLLLMTVLAVTSNNVSVRWLKRGWRRLHLAVYPAAALTFAHWLLTAFDPTVAYVHLGVLAALLLLRTVARTRRLRG